jgi:uncharacterized protein with HEPN domain
LDILPGRSGHIGDVRQTGARPVDYSEKIRRHTAEGHAALDNELALAGVLHWLGIIGEAATRLSSEVRDKHTQVPWRSIIGMRNILVHTYDHVDTDLVWKAVELLPALERDVSAILEDLAE